MHVTLTPLFWDAQRLVPEQALGPLDDAATGTLTILHTNDLHSSIDARPGSPCGGLARIASTIESARAAEPVLVLDAGDSVFGAGTWWCAQDARATSRLLTTAGYDLATIGNHDLERGVQTLRELLTCGRRLVSTNLVFDEELQRSIAPAYIAELNGLRIGIIGLTTTLTLRLVPRSVLRGVQYIDTPGAAVRAINALGPLVHSVVVLSHLGFDNDYDSDIHLIPALRGSNVSVILGGHTHEALDPAPVIDGILTCNAGAHGVNVNKVVLTRNADRSIEVRSTLLPQDNRVPESERLAAARARELVGFETVRQQQAMLPWLDVRARKMQPGGPGRDRELALLVAAIRHSGTVAADAIVMVPFLYIIGQLPDDTCVSRLDVLTVYPNAEHLHTVELPSARLREVISLQTELKFSYSALPVWLSSGEQVVSQQLDPERTYSVVMSELAAEGGLEWTLLRKDPPPARSLHRTCADLVWDYLQDRSDP